MKRKRKAQSFLEYSLFIAVLAVAIIAVAGIYFRRGLQGQIQQTGDGLAAQYSKGLTYAQDESRSQQTVLELNVPGWGAPNTITWTKGSQESAELRRILPLTESLNFGE